MSHLQISPRKCLVLEGNSCFSQRSNYPLQQPHQLFTMRVEGVNPQLLSHASRLPFAISTRCTERRRGCVLPDFTASSLWAQFKMSCPLRFHHGQWSRCPPSGEATILQSLQPPGNFSPAPKMHTKVQFIKASTASMLSL